MHLQETMKFFLAYRRLHILDLLLLRDYHLTNLVQLYRHILHPLRLLRFLKTQFSSLLFERERIR